MSRRASGVGVSLLALTIAGAALAAPPLPPSKPKGLQGPSVPAVARVPALRPAPLPPPRPPELAEEAPEPEEAQQKDEPADAASTDRFVREPERPAPAPRVASRETAPDAGPAAGAVPLPPERPRSPAVPAAPAPAGDAAPAAPVGPLVMPESCAALVEAGAIEASLDTSVSPNPACGLFVPVRLTGVRLGNGRMIPLKPAAVSRCDMAVAAASWMRDALAPAVAQAGGALAAIRIADSYNCRPRNRVAGAKMSEHGRGNAVDVGGFELDDGRVWTVAKAGLPMALRTSMKDSACTRFTTVLGPGSDGYHEDHIHVDLAQRRNDYRLCSWKLDAGAAVAARKDNPDASGARAAPAKDEDPAAAAAAQEEKAEGAAATAGRTGPAAVTPARKDSNAATPKAANARAKDPAGKDPVGKNPAGKDGGSKDARSRPPATGAAASPGTAGKPGGDAGR